MIKVLRAFLFALIIISAVYSQPKLTLTLTCGYVQPFPHLSGDVADSTDRKSTYLAKNGYNGGLSGKYAFGKKGNFRITGSVSYNNFTGEGAYIHTNNVDFHSHMTILSAGLGIEYAFLPKGKTNPFAGIEFTGNFISGEKEETSTAILDHDEGTVMLSLNSAVRYGLSAGGGVDLMLSKNFGAVFGFKYHFSNMAGKDYIAETNIGEYNLNDKENENSKAKNISYMQFYAGLTVYFGIPKK